MTTFHRTRTGYVVTCAQCRDVLMRSHWYDVAERFAERHEDATGHQAEVLDDDDGVA